MKRAVVMQRPDEPQFSTHLLQAGSDIRTVQELRGQRDAKTTMIVYTRVRGVQSPAGRQAGGVLGSKPQHPNAPRTEVSNGGPTA